MSYRTRRLLRRALIAALWLAAIGLLLWACWMVWIQRYVVYTSDGATLNFDVADTPGIGQLAQPPSADETVPIYVNEGLDAIETCTQMTYGPGYDHNYVLRKGSAMGLCAAVYHEESGRAMEVITDQPGVQLYTGCVTDIPGGKGGVYYGQYSGLCLETQHYPDTPNHPEYPTTVLRPGEKYDTTTIYAFRVEAE